MANTITQVEFDKGIAHAWKTGSVGNFRALHAKASSAQRHSMFRKNAAKKWKKIVSGPSPSPYKVFLFTNALSKIHGGFEQDMFSPVFELQAFQEYVSSPFLPKPSQNMLGSWLWDISNDSPQLLKKLLSSLHPHTNEKWTAQHFNSEEVAWWLRVPVQSIEVIHHHLPNLFATMQKQTQDKFKKSVSDLGAIEKDNGALQEHFIARMLSGMNPSLFILVRAHLQGILFASTQSESEPSNTIPFQMACLSIQALTYTNLMDIQMFHQISPLSPPELLDVRSSIDAIPDAYAQRVLSFSDDYGTPDVLLNACQNAVLLHNIDIASAPISKRKI